MGYHRAGFEVVGVDLVAQPHYPFEMKQCDWRTALEVYPGLIGFDAIHASPPCQDHMLTPHPKHGTGWLLDATRQLLTEQPLPWVIENVGRGIRADYRICGCQVGLKLRRVRLFETSWHGFYMMPPHRHTEPVVSVVGRGTPTWVREKWAARFGHDPTIADYREAMGIDWMNRVELSQAIPPAYTEFVGRQLIAQLDLAPPTGAADSRATTRPSFY
jgi:DNA (cytosine-5)-methyltransferase 1